MSPTKKLKNLLRERVVGANAMHQPKVFVAKRKSKTPRVKTWGSSIEPPNDFNAGDGASMVFIDHMPGANFEHRVQYAFVNEQNEIISLVEATTPPDDLDTAFEKVDLEDL